MFPAIDPPFDYGPAVTLSVSARNETEHASEGCQMDRRQFALSHGESASDIDEKVLGSNFVRAFGEIWKS